MNYFSLNSNIFSYDLSPSELMVFSAISSIKNAFSYVAYKAKSISERTGLSERTVYRALERLQTVGLLSRRFRYRAGGYRASNGYTVASVGGGKFQIDRAVWHFGLDASSFMVYVYLSKAIDNRTREAFPSLNRMWEILQLCKNTIIAKIRKLCELGLIFKEQRFGKSGKFISNVHMILNMFSLPSSENKKENEHSAMCSFGVLRSAPVNQPKLHMGTLSICSLTRWKGLFKRKTGVVSKIYNSVISLMVHFWQSCSYTHSRLQQRNEQLSCIYISCIYIIYIIRW